ncbi:hypothetical protein AWC29_08015 [Mycobacterium triplex]|uniref:Uncharacterized protein n=1 Tax=Mycobacterium triplex TaxID=47839 RepID=A0A024JRP1_9MYCO|nr:hypothetical protein [Mycobacterium triplex]ORX06743.1 hypothetical protein AWC29_08015 [Mycobacterium triplex]CDO85913.1 hypothetical protein BN973_00249 [Mycobacterium triplex]
MPHHFGNDDDHGGIASALNFSGTGKSAGEDVSGGDSVAAALRGYAPAQPDDTLDAMRAQTRAAKQEEEENENEVDGSPCSR